MARKTNAPTPITAESLPNQLVDLAQRRQHWELHDLTRSNNVLYGLLGDCLDIYKATQGNRTLASALDDYLQQTGLTTQSNPSLQLRIVRAVFVQGNAATKHDARLLGYAKVIKFAADNQCTGAAMAKFISKHNGIDAIRRLPSNGSKKQPRMTAQDARQLALDHLLQSGTKALFKKVPLPDSLQPLSDQSFSVALLRREADGTGSVVFGINSIAAVNAVLMFAGRQFEAETGRRNTLQVLADQAADKQAALDNFKQCLTRPKATKKMASA